MLYVRRSAGTGLDDVTQVLPDTYTRRRPSVRQDPHAMHELRPQYDRPWSWLFVFVQAGRTGSTLASRPFIYGYIMLIRMQ